jgi:hypothetical protein
MNNPPRPGTIHNLPLEPPVLAVTQVAAGLGVSLKTLSLNGHAVISPGAIHRHPRRRLTYTASSTPGGHR